MALGYFRNGGTLANRASNSFILFGSFGVSTFPDMILMPRPSFSTRKVGKSFCSLSLRSMRRNSRSARRFPKTQEFLRNQGPRYRHLRFGVFIGLTLSERYASLIDHRCSWSQ